MDDAIFEKIYEETARPLWAYAARVSGSGSAADDILQETYLRFLKSPPREIVLTQAKPYLYKIATNLVYDRFRRLKRESASGVFLAQKSETLPETFSGETEMTLTFSQLKEQERALLWLAYVEGYDHREIAGILKLKKLSVPVLLFRARRKLAALLEAEKK